MHFVHSLNEGGIERLLYELCRKIDREKFEIQICCIKEKGILYKEFEKSGIKLHFLDAEKEFSLLNLLKNFKKLYKVRKLLLNESINVTHGHEFYSTIFSRIPALFTGAKLRYITLHNMYYWWSKPVHSAQRLLSFITTKIICNSRSTFEFSLIHDKIKPLKYQVIYNGIDVEKFSQDDKDNSIYLNEFGFTEEDYICVSLGNISQRKGFEYIIETANYLKSEYRNLKFLIVGGEHHEEKAEFEKISSLILKYELSEIVKITGTRNDAEKLLNLCDLYIMPSVAEGFGLALTEAMSMEKVVLVSDIAPFKEIVNDDFNGYFFESGNFLSLSEKLIFVLNLPKSVNDKIRKNARDTVIEKFNLSKMVREYEKLYNFKNNN